jgi:hypothetical protein
MPQYLLKVSPAYAKSHFGVVIEGVSTANSPDPMKAEFQFLSETPDQIVIDSPVDPDIVVDLDPPIDPDLPTVEQDPLLGQVEIIRTGGNVPPIFPNVQSQGQPPAIDGEGNLVG